MIFSCAHMQKLTKQLQSNRLLLTMFRNIKRLDS